MYTKQLLIVTSIVFDKILSAITVGLRTFPFSMSIILTGFNCNALAIIVISVICSVYLSCLVQFILLTSSLLNSGGGACYWDCGAIWICPPGYTF